MFQPAERQPRSGVLERAFSLLAAFDDKHTVLPLAALARSSGLPRNTTLRLARTLVELGALEQGEDGSYTIGIRLFEIAALAPRGHGLRRIAMPFLGDLVAATGQHVLLSVREGAEAVLVERLTQRAVRRLAFRIGGRMPLEATGAGLILLAYAPPDVQEAAIAGFRPTAAGDPLTATIGLRHRLAGIRRDGHVVAHRAAAPARATAAAPIRDGHGAIVAAVSIVTATAGDDVAAFVPAVATVARVISRQLSAR